MGGFPVRSHISNAACLHGSFTKIFKYVFEGRDGSAVHLRAPMRGASMSLCTETELRALHKGLLLR